MANQIYRYFLIVKNEADPLKTIEEIFNVGIKFRGTSLSSAYIYDIGCNEDKNFNLNKEISTFTNDDNLCFVVKIPKPYIQPIQHRDGKIDIVIPILKDGYLDEEEKTSSCSILTPHLIQGVYSKKFGAITNPNYSPVFDAKGLNYTDEQYRLINSSNINSSLLKQLESMSKRRDLSYEEIWERDIKTHFLDEAMSNYAKTYPRNNTKPFSAYTYTSGKTADRSPTHNL